MRIVTIRRISQAFFFVVFAWFCVVATFGTEWWQLRGWPVNWFFQLDPLVALGTVLTTHTLYAPLLWALVTVILTVILGRFFCGWVCPFGTLHHFVGFLGNRNQKLTERIRLNQYRKAQSIKYYILILLLLVAAVPISGTSLLTGLLDPISLISRSVNLLLLPTVDKLTKAASATQRFYEGGWLILAIFFATLFLNLLIPRFYCRFICPLGAFFGILSRFSLWRIGKNDSQCPDCNLCEKACEGACEPTGRIRISECVLCLNCLDACQHERMSFQTVPSLAGETTNPDISRRGFVLSIIGGVCTLPALRLNNQLGANYQPQLIRPPGALPEQQFLQRCIRCGQCVRICPTNVLQPAGIERGLEPIWTPVLNNRIGSSGCQLNCVACGYLCPTAAIRPISLDEKLGVNKFADTGPIKIGTAFIDQGRCLPWAMDRPCIVCQENCPVSPKAIFTREYFSTIRNAIFTVKHADQTTVQSSENNLPPGAFATGDYYCKISGAPDEQRKRISANTENTIIIANHAPWKTPPAPLSSIEIQIRLQRPYVDIEKCIGCGICEHECPVSGKRAIRISAEGESRNPNKKLPA